jgi:hypothetical protein
MSYGFVYVLGNPGMKGVYKVGFTNRSPSLRREELSGGTSVPADFDLICYAEYEHARQREQEIHELLKRFRLSRDREFFRCDLLDITSLVMDEELACSICEHQMHAFLYEDSPKFKSRVKVSNDIARDCGIPIVEPAVNRE